jgi:hypothetical protein
VHIALTLLSLGDRAPYGLIEFFTSAAAQFEGAAEQP